MCVWVWVGVWVCVCVCVGVCLHMAQAWHRASAIPTTTAPAFSLLRCISQESVLLVWNVNLINRFAETQIQHPNRCFLLWSAGRNNKCNEVKGGEP